MPTTGSANSDNNPTPAASADERAAQVHLELERAVEHAAKMQAEHDEALADPGVNQEDRDAATRSLEYAHSELELARSAVERLDSGTYGQCETCGDDIGEERLAALAGVTTCMRCAD